MVDDVGDVGFGYLSLEERHFPVGEAGLGPAAQIHHDLDELRRIGERVNGLHHIGRNRPEKQIEIVDQLAPRERALISHVLSCHWVNALPEREPVPRLVPQPPS